MRSLASLAPMRFPAAAGRRPGPSGRSRSCQGFSLLELLLTVSVLAIGMMFFTGSVIRLHQARRSADEELEVLSLLERTVATLRSMDPTEAIQTYGPNALQPMILARSNLSAPLVSGLLSDPLDATQGAQVNVQFFTDETANLPEVGLPRDLDGDGLVNNTDTSRLDAEGRVLARLLPIRVQLTYRSQEGDVRTTEWHTVLSTDVRGG